MSARLLLVGAGFTGRVVAQEYARTGRLPEVVGFVDDDPARAGDVIEGLMVFGSTDDIPAVVQEHSVTGIVIAIPSLTGPDLRRILDRCAAAGVPVRTMPSIVELLGEPLTTRLLRPVHAADLLRRAAVDCEQPPEGYLRDATVLITGAGGSIGTELARQVARATPARLVLLGHGENSIYDIASQLAQSAPALPVEAVIADVRDASAIDAVMARVTPDVVFHAAAHKHVPLMQHQAAEAVRNNVLGTQVVVDAAAAHGIGRFVLISTDKAVRPVSVMGATKRLAEMIVRSVATRTSRPYVTVRFGNVLGSRGSLVPVLERQIARGGPITITDARMTRFFLTIPEAVFLVLRAGGLAALADLFVLDMGEPIRIVDLADDVVRLAGYVPGDIDVIYTGLRPGEKLHEELWEPGSDVTSVSPGVFAVREPGAERIDASLRASIDALVRAARENRTADVMEALRVLAMADAPHA